MLEGCFNSRLLEGDRSIRRKLDTRKEVVGATELLPNLYESADCFLDTGPRGRHRARVVQTKDCVNRTCAALISEETLNVLNDGFGLRMQLLKLLDEFHAFFMIGGAACDLGGSSVNTFSVVFIIIKLIVIPALF